MNSFNEYVERAFSVSTNVPQSSIEQMSKSDIEMINEQCRLAYELSCNEDIHRSWTPADIEHIDKDHANQIILDTVGEELNELSTLEGAARNIAVRNMAKRLNDARRKHRNRARALLYECNVPIINPNGRRFRGLSNEPA